MLRIFLFLLALFFAAVTGLVTRRIYTDQAGTSGFASFYVGGQTVTVDRAMIRDNELRDGGAVNRLDLALTWPEFRPAGMNIGQSGHELVFVAIEDAAPKTRNQDDVDPADRPSQLYARFLEQDTTTTAEGLVSRRFKANSPYNGEELFVATPDERAFAARCPLAAASMATPEERCLWQIRANGLDVHIRFSRRVLAGWSLLTEQVQALVQQMAVRRAR